MEKGKLGKGVGGSQKSSGGGGERKLGNGGGIWDGGLGEKSGKNPQNPGKIPKYFGIGGELEETKNFTAAGGWDPKFQGIPEGKIGEFFGISHQTRSGKSPKPNPGLKFPVFNP